jgi:hypothetical protein
MRLFSWSGWSALATAAIAGYLTNEVVHGDRGCEQVVPIIDFSEESEFVDRGIPGKLPTLPAEEIDLTCLPPRPPEEANRQTAEPPLADGPEIVRAIEYRPDPDPNQQPFPTDPKHPFTMLEPVLRRSPELPPPPSSIPYLCDDTPPPAALPVSEGEDAVNAYPVRQCSEPPAGPVWEAVSKFFTEATKWPSAHIEKRPALPGEESDWLWDARWQPMGNDEPDPINPNLGKPPTGVLPVIPEIPDRTPMPRGSGSRRPPAADG